MGPSIIKKGGFFELETGQLRVGFVSASGFLCTSFGSSSGAPEGFRKDSRRIPEETNKKTGNKYEEDKNAWFFPGRNNRIFISQRLCTHSAILAFYTPIFGMSTGFPASGSGVCGERIYSLCSGDATQKLFVDEISNLLKNKNSYVW